VKPHGGLDVEFESGAKGDGGELISEECGVGEDVVGLDGDEGEYAGEEVECGEADGVATAEVDR
jgi:hypothetical protein